MKSFMLKDLQDCCIKLEDLIHDQPSSFQISKKPAFINTANN
jgi:hypothetical protein